MDFAGIDFILDAAALHLNMVEVKGEMNLNNQLVAIQKIREAKAMLKEEAHGNQNEQGKDDQR